MVSQRARAVGTLGVADEGWRLRAGATVESEVVVEGLRAGELVEVLAEGWVHVRVRGVTGWIRADALAYGGALPSEPAGGAERMRSLEDGVTVLAMGLRETAQQLEALRLRCVLQAESAERLVGRSG